MSEKLFETALGIGAPWFVAETDFNAQARTLTIRVDFTAGTRFAVSGLAGEHPVHDTVSKRYRHLNFFQPESLPAHGGSICRTAPSGNFTRGTRTSRKHSC